MSSVGAINTQLGMDTSRFSHGLKSSIAHTRSWSRDFARQFDAMLTPMQRFQKELTRLNVMRAGVFDKGTQTTLRLSADQHALAVKRLRLEYSKLIPTLRTAQQRFLAVGTSMRTFFGSGGLMLGMAAVGTAFKAGRTSEGFEKAMRGSLAIMFDVTAQQKILMREQAKSLSGEVLASAKNLAGAYYYLAQTGMSANAAIAALPTVARFAQAGLFDLKVATDLLTDAQIAMGLASKDPQKNLRSLTHVGNVLVKASTLANASVQQFSEALTTKAAATGRLYAQSIEEVVTVLAAFAAAGVKGAAGGEQYSIVMRHLAINAVKNAEAFERLKVNVFDANRGFSAGADIIRDLDRAMKNMSPRQKVMALMELGFTKKTIASTGVLLGMSEALAEVGIGLEDVGGVMKRVADDQLTAFQVGWNKVRQGFENLSIDVGVHVMKNMGDAMEGTAKQGGLLAVSLGLVYDAWAAANIGMLKWTKWDEEMKLAMSGWTATDKEISGQKLYIRELGVEIEKMTKAMDRNVVAELSTAFNDIAAAIDEAGGKAKEQGSEFGALAEEIENARKASTDFLNTWRDKVITHGLTDQQKALQGLAAESKKFGDNTAAAYAEGRRLIGTFYAMERATKDRKRAASLAKGVQAPIQAFSEGAEEAFRLRKMLGEGAFSRLIDKYRETALSAMLSGKSGSVKLPAAMTINSPEGYAAVARGGQANIQKQTLAVAKRQLAAALRQIELAEEAAKEDAPVDIRRR